MNEKKSPETESDKPIEKKSSYDGPGLLDLFFEYIKLLCVAYVIRIVIIAVLVIILVVILIVTNFLI